MYPFLILSSLSVGFYLFLLVALHRDAKRHHRHITGTHPTQDGGRAVFRLARSNGVARPVFVSEARLHPVTRVQWKPAARTSSANQSKPVIAAAPANSVSQVKFG